MKTDNVIGVMSGSSLDGLDMALCALAENENGMTWQILDSITIPYSGQWYHALKNAPALSGFELMKLDAAFGEFIGHEIKMWMMGKNVSADYVASHGHTVFHEPTLGFTTQIGSGAHIAEQCSLDTITCFRNADVAFGGQGAPFSPAADRTLFPGYDAYLNLGGIANIYLQTNDDRWLAWDIGPCNQALNYLARRAGQDYDKGGLLASQGAVLDAIREDLIAMFPFHGGSPKSISNSQVNNTWIEYLEARKEDALDLLTTATLAIADLITLHLSAIIKRPSKILVTGGGAYNNHLIEQLRRLGTDIGITYEIPEQQIIEHKESLLMAYLGYLTMHGKGYGINALTGASCDCIGGAVYKTIK
jgi:anhydro-N-acetylmuramic acid kinase